MPRIEMPQPLFDRPQPSAPQRKAGGDFGKALFEGLGNLATQIAPAVGSALGLGGGALGLPGLAGTLGGGGLGGMSNAQMLMLQYQIQQEMLRFNLLSNISKTQHDAKMNAVRNIRT